MLIFFIVLSKPSERMSRNRQQNSLYNSLKNEVGFSKDQLDQYQLLREEQNEQVKPLFNNLRNAKKNFYGLIYAENVPDSLISSKADSIAESQKGLDMQMFRFFRKTRGVCTTDQLEKFDTTMKKVFQRMVGRGGKGNSPHNK